MGIRDRSTTVDGGSRIEDRGPRVAGRGSRSTPAQAKDQATGVASKFSIPIAADVLKGVDKLLDEATITLVQGLLFHALKTAADKEKLRAAV
eukprot:6396515-Pyramimonas_sp.AAC.1